jgi:Xaa-Pro aminopeptidase
MHQRLERVRAMIAEQGLDGLVVTHPANRRYLTGYTAREELPDSVVGACFIDERTARLLTGRTNLDRAKAEVESRGFEADTWERPWPAAVAKEIAARGWKRVGFEEGAMTVAFHRDVLAELDCGAELIGIGDAIVVMRRQKDGTEIALYERIAKIGDDAFSAATAGLTAGTTERELANRIDAELEARGSEGPSFPTIVAAGPHAAHPHHDPGHRPIEEGEPVIIDMGAMLDGYHGDLTRTIWVGEPTQRLREVYAAVEAAQAAGIAAIRTGATWEAPDSAARAAFADAGLSEYLIHGLGHAVGYNVHEQPMMAPGALDAFAGGEVMTVEPGLYIPGWGGVRIEDVGVVEHGGLRVITHAPKASFL